MGLMGYCPDCHQRVKVTAKGLVRTHTRYGRPDEEWRLCTGARKPATVTFTGRQRGDTAGRMDP